MSFELSNEAVALIGFVSLFVLMLLRVPVGMAMGLVGITGFGYLTGFAPALKLVIGDVSAVLLIAIRTWRLIFHPEDIHDAKIKTAE
jgi:hypothetical protein